MRVIMPRFSHRLALKIVLPFAALTLAIGAVGTLTATGELNARSQEGFDSQLVHDGFVTQSMVVAGEVICCDFISMRLSPNRSIGTGAACRVHKFSGHAARAYSWINPPSRSRRWI